MTLEERMGDAEFEEVDDEKEVNWEEDTDTSLAFDPSQKRAPKGSDTGGQWTDGGNGGGRRSKKEATRLLRKSGYQSGMPSARRLTVQLLQRYPDMKARVATVIAESVGDYTAVAYTSVNRKLRKGGTSKYIKNIATGFAACEPVRKGVTVYRGVTLEGRSKVLIPKLKPGKVITDKGFMSTTRSRGQAEGFGSTIFELKDHRGIGRDLTKFGINRREKEVIYPPGTRIKVRKVSTRGDFTTVYGDIL